MERRQQHVASIGDSAARELLRIVALQRADETKSSAAAEPGGAEWKAILK